MLPAWRAGGGTGGRELPPGAKLIRGHIVTQEPPRALLWAGNLGMHAKEDDIQRLFAK